MGAGKSDSPACSVLANWKLNRSTINERAKQVNSVASDERPM
jgi:hypothetical protein